MSVVLYIVVQWEGSRLSLFVLVKTVNHNLDNFFPHCSQFLLLLLFLPLDNVLLITRAGHLFYFQHQFFPLEFDLPFQLVQNLFLVIRVDLFELSFQFDLGKDKLALFVGQPVVDGLGDVLVEFFDRNHALFPGP